jgi:aspartate 1-decarboxylase
MTVYLLKSKIHRATVTDGNVNYEGSLTLSEDLMEAVGFVPYERILVGNMANGNRFETYLIVGPRNEGKVCLNGATAHLGKPGDLLTIMSFAGISSEEVSSHEPRVVTLKGGNQLPPLESRKKA